MMAWWTVRIGQIFWNWIFAFSASLGYPKYFGVCDGNSKLMECQMGMKCLHIWTRSKAVLLQYCYTCHRLKLNLVNYCRYLMNGHLKYADLSYNIWKKSHHTKLIWPPRYLYDGWTNVIIKKPYFQLPFELVSWLLEQLTLDEYTHTQTTCGLFFKDILDKIIFGYLCQIITPSTF